MSELRARQDGDHVLIVIDGRAQRVPWNAALQIADAIRAVAKQAEAYAAAQSGQLITDQAILIRSGAAERFGLTNDPRVMAEAVKEAAHDRKLRRYIPWGIRSSAAVGAPTIIQHRRPK